MNKNQIQGTAKNIVGKAQVEAGKLVDSKEQQVKGLGKQIAGTVQKTIGDAKEIARNASKHS